MVAIVTDSAANLPSQMARDLGIQVVPMYLKFGDRVYRDGVDLTPADFYRLLAKGKVAASTSTPSPGDYLQAFERSGHGELVCITVASSMSSSHQQATAAASQFSGRVEVLDSGGASMAEGFAVAEAARAVAAGASLEAAAERARAVSARTKLYGTVDTFEFLRRSGRVTKLQAYAATMLDIKPVFGFAGGEIVPVSRSRTRRRALAVLEENSVRDIGSRRAHLAVFHAHAEAVAAEILARIAGRVELVEQMTVEVTPVIGAHTGPGLVGT
ncbi:MAG TPA: DegV family protein, partial [Actinomycetota bacterium]